MGRLQATWNPSGQLFLWSSKGSVDEAIREEVPEFSGLLDTPGSMTLAALGPPIRRRKVDGVFADLQRVLPLLPALRNDEYLSDSLRCWSMAARFALELAVRQVVAPGVRDGQARWQTLLTRRSDLDRFDALVAAMPAAARLAPTRDQGPLRLPTSEIVVRSFLDAVADTLFRCNAWPGPARGWVLELADALRGDQPTFNPRDARCQGVPAKLSAWATGEGARDLHLGMTLSLPQDAGSKFPLALWLHDPHDPTIRVSTRAAWRAGGTLRVGDRTFGHPAYTALRALARAKRIFPPIAATLAGAEPIEIAFTPAEAWKFLHDGVQPLQDAGYEVELPASFSKAGTQRLRARLRIAANADAGIDLAEMLTFHWEVVLGDFVLSEQDIAELLAAKEPLVRFHGTWVLIDPAELSKVPQGLPRQGKLDAAEALRAVLTGQHDGIPVVADDRLRMVIDALRNPPERAVPRRLLAELRPYQQRGYEWLACLGDLGLGACLADDMGLGKTVQLVAHIVERHSRRRDRPSLVVCPTSVLGNWTRELARFAPHLRVARHHGLTRNLKRSVESADVVLTTYGLLARDGDALADVAWDVVALDEAQSIKNPDSRRAKSASGLKARHRVGLSGTPVENRLEELWSLMRFLVPGLLGTRANFLRTVAIPVERFGDEDVALRLKMGVSPFLLRRVKTDPTVVDDLPDKIEKHEYCGLTGEQASLYREISEEHLDRIAGASASERRGQVLAMLTALKQICNHPDHYLKENGPLADRSGKLERATELLGQVIDQGERAIVFTQYREMGERLVRHFLDVYGFTVPFLHGGVPVIQRDAMVRRFQEDENASPILLISLRAGGTGLNLTRATHVVHYDRWWNPAVEDQATDRAYRIGQHRNVLVHKFVCQGTLEERIDALLDDKRSLAESVVGSGERLVTELDDAALRALVSLGDDAVVEDA